MTSPLPLAWDTTLLSRVRPGSDDLDLVMDRWATGDPVATPATAVHEVAYGLAQMDDPRAAAMLALIRASIEVGALTVLPFDAAAAILAGEVLALRPDPPPAPRDRRQRARRRIAWHMDVHIAATAYVHGYGVRTANVSDHMAVGEAIAKVLPGAPLLAVAPH